MKYIKRVLVIASSVAFVVVVLGLYSHFSQPARAAQRLVSIYADGRDRTIATDATTVGQALDRANVGLGSHDRSEPQADAKITSDNFNINVYRGQPITIIDGTKVVQTLSSYQTPAQIVNHAGIKTSPEDQYDLSVVQNLIKDQTVGEKVTILRAKTVNFDLYGSLVQVKTASTTVGDLLKERNVSLRAHDKISVTPSTSIVDNMIIDISGQGKYFKTIKKSVPFTEQQIQDVNQPVGYRQIKTPGVDGTQLTVYQADKSGKIVSQAPLQQLVTDQPVQQVVVVGAKPTAPVQAANFSGDLSAAFSALRSCEAGGIYSRNSGNGYYGAYQYDISTWAGYGGYGRPDLAPPQVQDQKALITYNARGWSPWPACSAKLGL